MSTLSFERGTAFTVDQVQLSSTVERLIEIARQRGLLDDDEIVRGVRRRPGPTSPRCERSPMSASPATCAHRFPAPRDRSSSSTGPTSASASRGWRSRSSGPDRWRSPTTTMAVGPTATWPRSRTRSAVAPPRSNATSSPSECSGCPADGSPPVKRAGRDHLVGRPVPRRHRPDPAHPCSSSTTRRTSTRRHGRRRRSWDGSRWDFPRMLPASAAASPTRRWCSARSAGRWRVVRSSRRRWRHGWPPSGVTPSWPRPLARGQRVALGLLGAGRLDRFGFGRGRR